MQQSFWHVLARTWAAVAFFHPFVQEQGRAWEETLVSVLSQAEAVAEEPLVSARQREVLETLLATLNDNATCLAGEPLEQARIRPIIEAETLADNVAYIRVCNWFNFHIAPGYFGEWEEAIRSLNQAIERAARGGAPALILDFRETKGDYSDQGSEARYVTGRMRAELVAHLFSEPVRLPGVARIQRTGYHDPVASGETLGGYQAEWVMQVAGAPVRSVADAFAGRIAVLTARETSSLLEPVLILLQRTQRAICIGEQSFAYHFEDQVVHLTDELSLQLRRHVLIYHDQPARYVPDVQAEDPLAAALELLADPAFKLDEKGRWERPAAPGEPYREELPERPQRILAVIKLWTAMREFYSYREHLANWDEALVPAIHEAAGATTREAYFVTLQRLSACCKGGHNFVLFTHGGELRQARCPYGFAPGVRLARVGGKIIIGDPLEPDVPVESGAVLEAVDGEPVEARERRLRSLFNQYPAGAVDYYLLQALLDSAEGASVGLRLRDARGEVREITLVADHPVSFVTEPVAVTTLPAWGLLSGEFTRVGYLDASRVTTDRIAQAFEELAGADAIIVDLRRYPSLHVGEMRRFQRYAVPVLRQQRPVVIAPEGGVFGWLENRFYDSDVIEPPPEPDARPLAALIGGGLVSMGEDWAYQLLIGCGATLVGGVTAGGVGSNTWVSLPGLGRASFSGAVVPRGGLNHGIEGNGIEPHIWVEYVPADGQDVAVVVAARMLLQKLAGSPVRYNH